MLVDVDNDREISELLSIMLFDKEHYLWNFVSRGNEELLKSIVDHYALGVPFEEIVRERVPGEMKVKVRQRACELEREMRDEIRRLKQELKRELREMQRGEEKTIE